MPRKSALPHVKTVRSKGRTYLYFDTGKTDGRGRKIYAKLPPKDSPSFGATYGAMMRPLTAIECLLSGFPMGTLVSAGATQAEVVAAGPVFILDPPPL